MYARSNADPNIGLWFTDRSGINALVFVFMNQGLPIGKEFLCVASLQCF